MKTALLFSISLIVCDFVCTADPALTIYNQNFAVVHKELPLNLKAGPNKIQVTDITMHLEPDSVILRDPSGKHPIQVLEQNSRRSSPAKSSAGDIHPITTWL